MLGLFLSLICFGGYVYLSSKVLKIPMEAAPLFSISMIGLLLFGAALAGYLKTGALVLEAAGLLLGAGGAFKVFRQEKGFGHAFADKRVVFFFFLLIISFAITLGMKFTTIDDYVYWGIIGKYLYCFDHLPTPDTTIIRQHLGYTPGMALIHYWQFRIMGSYSMSVSYFAQNFVLISGLFVLFKKDEFSKNFSLFTICMLLFTLFAGSIFTKLQVDYLLSLIFFAVLWAYFTNQPSVKNILILAPPIIFLYLIKEVGLLLSLLLISIIFLDVICNRDTLLQERTKMVLAVFLTASVLFVVKGLWDWHCREMKFPEFSGGITIPAMLDAVNVFSSEQSRSGMLIFLKSLLLGEADRLNLPYILWYAVLGGLWIIILRRTDENREDKSRLTRLLLVLCAAFFIYCLMNYFMQVIVFNVGRDVTGHTVGLERYLNILFIPLLVFPALWFFWKKVSRVAPKKIWIMGVVLVLVISLSRAETTLRREKHFSRAEAIAGMMNPVLAQGRINRICIVPGVNDNDLWIQLLYYLLPNRISHGRFPAKNKTDLLKNLTRYDYVYFDSDIKDVIEWLKPYMDETPSAKSFFRISSGKGTSEKLRLERMF